MGKYTSKTTDSAGIVHYTEEENETWQILLDRQMNIIHNRACLEFMAGLEQLDFPRDRVPQCYEITTKLREATGWSVQPVPALISLKEFFQLLANKQFPAATFIRRKAELDYLQEPDIFHEFFGHCPLLTNPVYAAFVEWYGKTALQVNEKIQSILGRLFWFTIEFGLLDSQAGLRIYGGGILSSYEETVYAIESPIPTREVFNINKILGTHYRYDIIQERYFVIDNLTELFEIQKIDIIHLAEQAAGTKLEGKDFNIC
jgi:phenylalanine-4-hydroxylase